MRKLFAWRWITIAIMAAGLTGLTATSASADVNYNPQVPDEAVIVGPGCGDPNAWGYWGPIGDGWQNTSSADYTGGDVYGDPWSAQGACDGTSQNVLTQTTVTAQFIWKDTATASYTQNCQVYAYIPSNNAGDYNTRYDFWGDNTTTNYHTWLGWPGQTINQEPLSGWIQIGIDLTVPANTQLSVTLSNADPNAPGRWAGAGDMAFYCQ